MDACPNALYQNLLSDLSAHVEPTLLKVYLDRVDFPVGAPPKMVAAISIARSLLKKYRYTSNDTRDSSALLKFLETNNRCKNWKLLLTSSKEEMLVNGFRKVIDDFWHPNGLPLVSHPYSLLDSGGVGPGASIKGRGGDFYTKLFDSSLSSTRSNLYFWYKRYVSQFPSWDAAEKLRHQNWGDSIVAGNRLDFVPKNDKTSRTICIEPTLNMFYQLGLGHIIERRLISFFGISLADQQFKNRELARQGSVFDCYSTIDLESASDSMSINMLKSMLPPDFFRWLEELRSPHTDIPGLGCFTSDMISTMGNGFTFPLQTLIFSAAVIACFRFKGIKILFPRGTCYGNFGVNGDDIVVPKEISADLVTLLRILGFSVNSNKSFFEGPFRESCGGDYYLGHPVRGVYVKALDTTQARYVAINQLNQFSIRTGIFLPRSVQYLTKTVKFLAVPMWEMDDSGIRLHSSFCSFRYDRNNSIVYQKWEPHSKKIRITESAIFVPRGSKPRKYNPEGLLLSFLRRVVNSFSIGVRHDTVRYRRRRCIAPNWDYAPHSFSKLKGHVGPEEIQGLDERCKTALYLNFYM